MLTLRALSRKTYLCFEEQRDSKQNVYNFVQLTAKMYLHNFSLISHDFDLFDKLGLKKKTVDLTKLSTYTYQTSWTGRQVSLFFAFDAPRMFLFQHSSSVKYLGLFIDCHLSWHDHIEYICSKISKNINIMTKVKKLVSKVTIINMYYSFIYPYLTYMVLYCGVTIIIVLLMM